MSVNIRRLADSDRPAVFALLAADHLRPEGVLEDGTAYWGAFDGETLAGLIGCEYDNGYGLLRSAVVDPAYRGHGIGASLTDAVIAEAVLRRLEAVCLFSTGAGGYWQSRGFSAVSVTEVTAHIPNVPQVKLFEELGWLPTEAAYIKYLGGTA